MTECDTSDKPLLEKIQDLLERKPDTYDVTFSVGPEKKEVKALKVILKAASSVLEKEFEEKWEVAVVKNGEGIIPLPDFDPAAFELFVKLTTLDTWSVKSLEDLSMPPDQLLNLISICRLYEMRSAAKNLETVFSAFLIRCFHQFKDTNDFLELSQAHLKIVLADDSLPEEELTLFDYGLRWADFQCNKRNIGETNENIREVLGNSLFQIRFPTMSNTDFTKAIELKGILTPDEIINTYRYIGSENNMKRNFNATHLPFKTKPRKAVPRVSTVPPDCLHLSLLTGMDVVSIPPFVCNGSQERNFVGFGDSVALYALSFLGPIDDDSFYDVTVSLDVRYNYQTLYDGQKFTKRIRARKGQAFHFEFDSPIVLKAGVTNEWTSLYYQINYSLTGPNTSAVQRTDGQDSVLQEGDTKFRVQWRSNQLSGLFYKIL